MRAGWVGGCTWRRVGAGTVAATVLAGLTGACGGASPQPGPALAAYLRAWTARDWTAMSALVQRPPADFVAVNRAAATALGASRATYHPGALATVGSRSSAPLTSTFRLGGATTVSLHSTVRLVRDGSRWIVDWTPATIATSLGAGDHLAVARTWPPRAAVLGAGGAPLAAVGPTVTVGLAGMGVTDAAAVRAGLVAAGFAPSVAAAALATAAAHPTLFEPVGTVSEARYQQIKPLVHDLPGTRFQTGTAVTALTPDLAAHVVGSVGPITAQQLGALGAPYTASDVVGQGGLEEADERQLAGTPSITVTVDSARGGVVSTVATVPAVPGTPVRTTIDPTVQTAAEAALNGVALPAAMVVERVSTGEVLASVSRPTATGFDLALDGALPPGSTFKVVTAAALVQAGDTTATPAVCSPTITVGGRVFHNATGEATPGPESLETAFAHSCNTAFIGLAQHLTPAGILPAAAALFGIGTSPALGLDVYGGRVPAPATPVDLVATAIGQGQVTVSPLNEATVAAAVGSGVLRLPRLVVGAADDRAVPRPLPAAVIAQLRPMMAAVVTSGTAAGQGLPAGTFGKTGTAEYGSANPPQTDAWFIGYRNDLAFAVVVQGGGLGGPVAAPLAAKLLDALGPTA